VVKRPYKRNRKIGYKLSKVRLYIFPWNTFCSQGEGFFPSTQRYYRSRVLSVYAAPFWLSILFPDVIATCLSGNHQARRMQYEHIEKKKLLS
jgi:hypothetical protein